MARMMAVIGTVIALLASGIAAADDHGNTPATATLVAVGSITPGVIEPADSDYFRIDVVTPAKYVIYTRGTTDTFGRIYNSALTQVDLDLDSGETANFRLETNLSAGTYYVEVGGASNPAGYALHVEGPGAGTVSDDHGFSWHSATPMLIGSTQKGTIDLDGDQDYFRLTVATTAVYYMYSRGTTNTGLTLYNAQLQQIDGNDDSGDDANFRLEIQLTAGTYYLKIVGPADAAGYTLHVEGPNAGTGSDDHGSTPWSATPVDVGSVTKGALDLEGDVDYFRFIVQTAGTYVIYSRGSAITAGTLYNAQAQQLDGATGGGESGNLRLEIALVPGIYLFRVLGPANPSGYTFHVEGPGSGTPSDEHGMTPWSATPVAIGSVTNGALDVDGDIDYFRFTVLSGGTYSIFTSGATDTLGTLYGPAIQQVNIDADSGDGANFRIDMHLNPGTHYVKVSGTGVAGVGPYALHVAGAPGNCVGFADVGDGSPFCGNVDWLRNRDITLGCNIPGTLYCPNDAVTRLAMAAFLNRLGTALGTNVLIQQQNSGAVDPGATPAVCMTSLLPAANYARRAHIDGVFTARATADLDLAADPAISVDGGTTWLPLTGHNNRGFAAANRWGKLHTLGHVDIASGQTMRFAMVVSRAGLLNATTATDSVCNLRVRVEHRNAFSAPAP